MRPFKDIYAPHVSLEGPSALNATCFFPPFHPFFAFCFIRRAVFEELELTYPGLTAGAFFNTTTV